MGRLREPSLSSAYLAVSTRAVASFVAVSSLFAATAFAASVGGVAAAVNGAIAGANAGAAASGFGPLSQYSPPVGLQPIGSQMPACMAGMGMFGAGGGLTQAAQQIGSILKGNHKGAPTASGQLNCSTDGLPRSRDFENRCTLFYGPDGSFSQSRTDATIAQLTGMQSSLNQCQSTLKQVQSNIACIQQLQTQIGNEVSMFGTAFNQALTQAQTAVATQKQKEADVQNQINLIDQQLNGDKNSGAPGLLAVRDRLQQLANGSMYQQILQVEQQGQKIQQDQQMVASKIAKVTLSTMNSCFQSVQPASAGLRCPVIPGTPFQDATKARSPMEYLECQYQYAHLAVGNQIEGNNNFAMSQGQNDANSLSAALGAMFAQLPQGITFTAPSAQYNEAEMGQYYGALTLSAIQKQYVSAFNQYGSIGGQSVESYIQGWLGYCYSQAQNAITNAEGDPNSDIGAAEFVEKQAAQQNQTQFNQLTQQYATEWATDMGQVWHQYNSPDILGTAGCNNATLATQSACLENLHASLQSLLNGGQNVPQIPINIPSQFPGGEAQGGTQMAIPPCNGVLGCIQTLQNVSLERTQYQKTLTNQQQSYVQQAKAYLTNSIIQPSVQALQAMDQQASNIVQNMANQLAALRIMGSITPPAITGAQAPGTDKDGLPEIPSGSPPSGGVSSLLPSMDLGQTLQDINQAVAQGSDDIGRGQNRIANDLVAARSAAESCKAQSQVKNATALAQGFIGNCVAGKNPQSCTPDQESVIGQLTVALSGLEGMGPAIQDMASNSITNLNNWVTNCQNSVIAGSSLATEIENVCKCDPTAGATGAGAGAKPACDPSAFPDINNTNTSCGQMYLKYTENATIASDQNYVNAQACDISTLNSAKAALSTSDQGGAPKAGIGE